MLRFIFIAVLFLSIGSASAQNSPLMAQLDDQKKPYLNHTIGGKENFYSIGRMYNISPRIFAPYNGLELTSGLSIGQVVKIPLNETNFWQSGSRKGNETVVPVYHTLEAKETITSVSRIYNTDKSNIVSWNNMSSEKINVGEKIIIGFLKVDKTLSPLAAQGMGPRAEPNVPKPVEKTETITTNEEPKVKEEKKGQTNVTVNKKEEVKKESTPIRKPDIKAPIPAQENIIEYKGNGIFEDEFKTQLSNKKAVETQTLNGGFFKSTSGWSDGKFYILIDGVEQGKIIKISNPLNNKFIYVKVLASISETKPGAKEIFLISNAAAAQLGVQGNNFDLEISK
jgi:LysM repeat protein